MDSDSTKPTRFEIEQSAPTSSTKKKGRVSSRSLTRVFSEDYDKVEANIFDPNGERVKRWNKHFLLAALISIAIDPFFFFLPEIHEEDMCVAENTNLKITLTVIRSFVDIFYVIQIYVKFRTAYVVPSSRLLGRGELILDSSKISQRYLERAFALDFLASLPIPQLLIWLPIFDNLEILSAKISLLYFIMFQFFLRVYLIFKLTSEMTREGVVAESTSAGSLYNLVLFVLASHVVGALYYLLAIERQGMCWKHVCSLEEPYCGERFLDCRHLDEPGRASWYANSNISNICGPDTDSYEFGLVFDAIDFGIASLNFFTKYSYCLWWGLRSLSSRAEELKPSDFLAETHFCILISVMGLLLLALLIGTMETYLKSRNERLEEYRLQEMDSEEWMNHRQLPYTLRKRVCEHDLYKWNKFCFVDEEEILNCLPLDIRRDIKRHICNELVRRVPLFDQMDDCTVDAICEKLKPMTYTSGACLLHEGDPITDMLFFLHGHLDSYTTGGGQTGFLNRCQIGPGDFCGEELLTWALDPRSSDILPLSTRTITAIGEVEAFALCSKDMKFVATQFRKLHNKKLRHMFRVHSHQWRTWAACFIQAAWKRYKRGKGGARLKATIEKIHDYEETRERRDRTSKRDPGLSIYNTALALTIGRGQGFGLDADVIHSPVTKPKDPEYFD